MWLRRPLGTAIEMLAAIPSIIYGMWGLFVFAPIFQEHVQPLFIDTLGKLPVVGALFEGPPMGIGMMTAGIILAVMVIPFITAVMRDVFELVPPMLKESAYGPSSTTWEVTWKVVLPYTKVGVIGGIMLGLGRALGETMAITFVIGNAHRLSASLFAPGKQHRLRARQRVHGSRGRPLHLGAHRAGAHPLPHHHDHRAGLLEAAPHAAREAEGAHVSEGMGSGNPVYARRRRLNAAMMGTRLARARLRPVLARMDHRDAPVGRGLGAAPVALPAAHAAPGGDGGPRERDPRQRDDGGRRHAHRHADRHPRRHLSRGIPATAAGSRLPRGSSTTCCSRRRRS